MITFLLHSYGEFSPRQPLKRARWPHFDLLYIHQGNLAMDVASLGPVSLHAGEGILLFPGTRFSPRGTRSRAQASVQHFQIEADEDLPTPFDRLADRKHGAIVYRSGTTAIMETDIQRALAWAKLPDTPARLTMRRALLTLILGEVLQIGWEGNPGQAGASSPILLEWAAHQPLANLSVQGLAEAAGVSESTLRRQFRQQGEIGPREAICRIRLNEAKRLLCETAMPLKKIADRVGYASAIAFHNAFKRENQIPPGTYRTQHRTRG